MDKLWALACVFAAAYFGYKMGYSRALMDEKIKRMEAEERNIR